LPAKCEKIIVQCATCGESKWIEEYKYNSNKTGNFFCNNECRKVWLVKVTIERNKLNANSVKVNCINCNKEKFVSQSKYKRNNVFFCNKICHDEYYKDSYVTVKCKICGKEKIIHKFTYESSKTGNFFCSWECRGRYKTLIGRQNTNCSWCNKEISVINFSFNESPNHFCDRDCYINHQNNFHPLKKRIKINCSWCNKEIEKTPYDMKIKNNLFCDKECHDKFQRGGDKIIVECEYCGKQKDITPFKYNNSTTGYFFCSQKCQSSWQIDFFKACNNPNWKGGLSFQDYGIEFNRTLKEKIRDRDNRTCQLCGINEKEEVRLLSIHHIDYDKNNNDESNLISLCTSCHVKTNGNREYWKECLSKLDFAYVAHC